MLGADYEVVQRLPAGVLGSSRDWEVAFASMLDAGEEQLR